MSHTAPHVQFLVSDSLGQGKYEVVFFLISIDCVYALKTLWRWYQIPLRKSFVPSRFILFQSYEWGYYEIGNEMIYSSILEKTVWIMSEISKTEGKVQWPLSWLEHQPWHNIFTPLFCLMDDVCVHVVSLYFPMRPFYLYLLLYPFFWFWCCVLI